MKSRLNVWASVVLAVAVIFCATLSVEAATITVTNINDSGFGSLRQASLDAETGDTVNFDLPGCPCTIILTSGPIQFTRSFTLEGPGADLLTISGNQNSGVLELTTAKVMKISGITIANGKAS